MAMQNVYGTSSWNRAGAYSNPIMTYPAWLRFLAAMIVSISFLYTTAKHGRFVLTDESIKKLLFLALWPIAWFDYQIIRLRALTANFLGLGLQIVAV